MRKLLFPIFALLLTFNLKAQVNLSSYTVGGEQKQVLINAKDDGSYTLYIDMGSADKIHKDVGISVNSETHKELLLALTKAKKKFSEWTKVAKENNVTDLYKKMDFSVRVNCFFMYYDKWKFDYDKILDFHFMVYSSGGKTKYALILSTGELASSENEYMTMDGISSIFMTTESIQGFMDSISIEKVNSFMSKPKTEDLFK